MNKEDIWNLFKITGKINYYLLFKRLEKEEVDYIGNSKNKGNSCK